jgi:hypothetical protein
MSSSGQYQTQIHFQFENDPSRLWSQLSQHDRDQLSQHDCDQVIETLKKINDL